MKLIWILPNRPSANIRETLEIIPAIRVAVEEEESDNYNGNSVPFSLEAEIWLFFNEFY